MFIAVRNSDDDLAYINSKKIQSIEIEHHQDVDSGKNVFYIAFHLENRKYYHLERWWSEYEAQDVLEKTVEYVEGDE